MSTHSSRGIDMIKHAYINGFINKLAAYGMSWSDIVDSPFLQNKFKQFFKYPKIEPGEKALSDFMGRILTRKQLADMKYKYGTWPTNFIYASQPKYTQYGLGVVRDLVTASKANEIIDKAYKSLYGN